MSNPFAQTMTPPFTGQLWRASALHRAPATTSRSAVCGLRKRGSHFHHFPRPKTLGASKLDSLPWGNLGQDWPASKSVFNNQIQ